MKGKTEIANHFSLTHHNTHLSSSFSLHSLFFALCSFHLRYNFALQAKTKRSSIEHLSNIYRTSIEHLSNIYRTSIEDLSNIYRRPIEHLSKTYRTDCWWTDYWRRLQTLRYRILYRKLSFLMVNYFMIFFLSIDFSDCLTWYWLPA